MSVGFITWLWPCNKIQSFISFPCSKTVWCIHLYICTYSIPFFTTNTSHHQVALIQHKIWAIYYKSVTWLIRPFWGSDSLTKLPFGVTSAESLAGPNGATSVWVNTWNVRDSTIWSSKIFQRNGRGNVVVVFFGVKWTPIMYFLKIFCMTYPPWN